MLSFCLPQRWLALALSALLLLTLAACGSAAAPQEHSLTLRLTNGALSPDTVPAQQGDTLSLRIESDQPGAVHFHGYDLEQEVAPDTAAELQFTAAATGRFPITFHPVAAASGGTGHSHDHNHSAAGAVELTEPVTLELSSAVDPAGGLHIRISTENWQWAPEEVNQPSRPGVGHAHIYANGEKLSRVYGPYHYVPDLPPGLHQIKIDLNDNQHNALTVNGAPLETTIAVTIPDTAAAPVAMPEPAAAKTPLSLELMAHPDALGGYNLQIIPDGFAFDQQNYGQVSIDGQVVARAYTPWLQLPAMAPGTHTVAVALHNAQGQPLQHYSQPVAAAITVGDATDGGMKMAMPETAAGHDHEPASDAGETEELEVGFLVVTPR